MKNSGWTPAGTHVSGVELKSRAMSPSDLLRARRLLGGSGKIVLRCAGIQYAVGTERRCDRKGVHCSSF